MSTRRRYSQQSSHTATSNSSNDARPPISEKRRQQNRAAQQRFREKRAQKNETAAVTAPNAATANQVDLTSYTSPTNLAALYDQSAYDAFDPMFAEEPVSAFDEKFDPLGEYATQAPYFSLPTYPSIESTPDLQQLHLSSYPLSPLQSYMKQTQSAPYFTNANFNSSYFPDFTTPDFTDAYSHTDRPRHSPSRRYSHAPSPSPSMSHSRRDSSRSTDGAPSSHPSASSDSDSSEQQSPPILHAAVRSRRPSVVRILLNRGASTVDETDSEGSTALHVAIKLGEEKVIQLLLENGACLERRNGERKDALLLAVERGKSEIVKMVLDASARRVNENG